MTNVDISRLGGVKLLQVQGIVNSIILMEKIILSRKLTYGEIEETTGLIRNLERLIAEEKDECSSDLHSWCLGVIGCIVEDFLQSAIDKLATNFGVRLVSVEEVAVVGAIPYDDLPQFFICCKDMKNAIDEYTKSKTP